MNLEQMEYVVTVANEKSITKAANKLFISISGMSQAITQLENELGIKIFNRSKKGVTTTYEGKIVITKAVKLLETINELNEEIKNNRNVNLTHLKILTAPTFSYILQESIVKFSKENKNVTFELIEQNPLNILQSFNKENYDIAFISATLEELKKEKNIKYEHIHKGHICVAVGRNSPFYSYEFVLPSDLANEKIVIYKASDYNQLYKYTKMNINQAFMTTNKSSLLLELVKESQAILYLHDFTINTQPMVLNGDIKIIPLKEENYFQVDFWNIYLEATVLTEVAREFLKVFLEHFKQCIKKS
jgi:DNA-binding transcriptional LysR family regulator